MFDDRIEAGFGRRGAGRPAAVGACLLAAALALMPGAATAVEYAAVVRSAQGPHAARFPVGAAVSIAYELDPGAADTNPDPREGIYPNGVEFLEVLLPGLDIEAVAGPGGTLQTFDDVVSEGGYLSDQVFVIGGAMAADSLLGDEAIDGVEVDFLSDFVLPPAQPTMLDSDAVPLQALPLTDAFVQISTASGTTVVQIEAAPPVGYDDDSCAVVRPAGRGASAWPLLAPAWLLWWRRRRHPAATAA